MKNLKKVKFLVLSFILTIAFCSFNSNVSAKTMSPDEIPGSAYVIGSHMFTRDVNETTGYEGRLTTNLIMLAAQTIGSSDLDNMIIYYKTATGTWINGLTGNTIVVPETFKINYTNMQLEEDNDTVSKPKVPIVIYEPISVNEETDLITYQLDIYIDEYTPAMNPTNKAILKFTISFAPNIIRHITGNKVVIVVRILLKNVILTLSFTKSIKSLSLNTARFDIDFLLVLFFLFSFFCFLASSSFLANRFL